MSKCRVVACAVLLGCLGSIAGGAQEGPARRSLRIGPVASAVFSSFTGSDATDVSSRTVFSAGAAATVGLGPSLFFQPQVLYSLKGANASTGGDPAVYKLGYVELPLLVGYRVPMRGTGVRPFVVAGPTVAFMLRCHGHLVGDSTDHECNDNGEGVRTKSTEFGVTAGGGLELPVGGGMLALSARYSRGLSDIVSDYNIRNAGVSVGLGWSISVPR